ncbi:MAG: hypothetical protein CMJ39_02765 [Phycisphaerae bacterium]|nr:hypothetical protein [Phycisphaerae bacterium]|tara:strand:+ start:111 stop:578 length:468 start_codon:yes stop_codon:yes gene_type:complete
MMSSIPSAGDTPNPEGGLDHSTVSHLLGVAAEPAVRPADALAIRLGGEEGREWACRILESTPVEGLEAHDLIQGPTDLDQLKQLHRLGKKRFHDAESNDDRHSGLLWYLIAIAAAMIDHETELSSQPRSEVIDAILIVADSLPEDWRCRLEMVDQ